MRSCFCLHSRFCIFFIGGRRARVLPSSKLWWRDAMRCDGMLMLAARCLDNAPRAELMQKGLNALQKLKSILFRASSSSLPAF